MINIDINCFCARTHVGNVRKANEDSYGYRFMTPNGDLFVVCDGMGGHVGGAIASKIAVDAICQYMEQESYPDPRKALADALEFANNQILGTAEERPELKGMGTTACVILVQDDKVWIAHVGDSRIYIFPEKEQWLHRITKDHSFVQTLIDKEGLSEEEAEHHPKKNLILKALGLRPDCMPEVAPNPILPAMGDIFLICTDGLCGMLNDNMLQDILTQTQPVTKQGMEQKGVLEQKATDMITLALQAGGFDNVTLELIQIPQSPHPHSQFVSKNNTERINPKSEASTDDNNKAVSQPIPSSTIPCLHNEGIQNHRRIVRIVSLAVILIILLIAILTLVPKHNSHPLPYWLTKENDSIAIKYGNTIKFDNVDTALVIKAKKDSRSQFPGIDTVTIDSAKYPSFFRLQKLLAKEPTPQQQ